MGQVKYPSMTAEAAESLVVDLLSITRLMVEARSIRDGERRDCIVFEIDAMIDKYLKRDLRTFFRRWRAWKEAR